MPDLHFLIWSDYPTMLFENLIAERRAAANQAPTYLYRFDWRSPVQGGKYHTPHTMEIPFVFDNTKVMASMTGGTQEAAALAARISDAWIALATTGDPNTAGGGRTRWKPDTTGVRATQHNSDGKFGVCAGAAAASTAQRRAGSNGSGSQ